MEEELLYPEEGERVGDDDGDDYGRGGRVVPDLDSLSPLNPKPPPKKRNLPLSLGNLLYIHKYIYKSPRKGEWGLW